VQTKKNVKVFKEMIMKKGLLVIVTIILAMTGMAKAQDADLHGSFNLTYQSKYVWRGFDIYDDKSAVQTSLDLDLFGSGFGVSVTGHRANSSGFENGERWDYNLYYGNRLFGDECYAINYRLGWVYYNYPDNPSEGSPTAPNASLQELHAILSFPNMCSSGIVPTYVLVKMWPSESDSYSGAKSPMGGTASGFAHIFMLDYSFNIPGLVPEIPEHTINLHAEAVYNDGVGPAGQNVDHDWSNAVFGASTNIDVAENLVITPAVYYQITMDDSVNDDGDETWVTVGATYKF
jgi:uncharacterized protein (TIGR02001 family)